ncbi:MAG: S26 family signal peptidase [Anaerolineales bacterium]|nr:S26 family signal peptidase [Anaerolineales bacterium]MDP3184290.1 S26 family signal peptidase [Anaerolineales bacterium]
MFRLLKVTGDSLSPLYKEGDFVVITTLPFFLRRLRKGDIIVFQHGLYGTLIKIVDRVSPEGDEVYVIGASENSLDSRRLGPINRQAIMGKVICHIAKPTH